MSRCSAELGPVTCPHIFDMDGTLLRGSTASLETSRVNRTVAELTELERLFVSGALGPPGFATRPPALWRGLTMAQVRQAYARSPFLTGIAEVSPDFSATLLLGHGFDEVRASAFPAPPFTAPVVAESILTPADKVRLAEEVRLREGIALERCVAHGDSMSDVPLFRHFGTTVAVNSDRHLTEQADADYRGTSLPGACALGRMLLDAR
ncbi:HAD family hydrolase [Nocardiopsis ansamitocini]|uniref:HAD family hydrolase n=1 Tax=Nocardiopsis ansamitocini TaxID=1670832 RepID=UPI0032DB7CD5